MPQLADGDVVSAPWPDVAIAEIDPADIAAVAVKALTEDGHAGTAPMLTGPRATVPAERVRVLAEVLGRDLRYEPQSDAAARAEMEGTVPADTIDGFFRFFSDGEFDDASVTARGRGAARPPAADARAVGARARRRVPVRPGYSPGHGGEGSADITSTRWPAGSRTKTRSAPQALLPGRGSKPAARRRSSAAP